MTALPYVLAAVFAQTPATLARPSETFELDIAERRIHERGFHAATELRLEPAQGGLRIQVGAGLSARAIDVLLRNVRGTVRFHADTSRLEEAVRALDRTLANPGPHQQ